MRIYRHRIRKGLLHRDHGWAGIYGSRRDVVDIESRAVLAIGLSLKPTSPPTPTKTEFVLYCNVNVRFPGTPVLNNCCMMVGWTKAPHGTLTPV
jgi:hypothetical protein